MIYVVRHGQTDLNKERRLQGRRGLPLNEVGVHQAERVKEKLQDVEFDLVYSSPQERAVQTAEIVAGKKATLDDRLNVFDLGAADSLVVSEVKRVNGIPDPSIYNGVEDPRLFMKRVFHFMSELETNFTDKQILIAGHRCTTGGIGAYFRGIPEDENILQYSSDNGDYRVYEFKI